MLIEAFGIRTPRPAGGSMCRGDSANQTGPGISGVVPTIRARFRDSDGAAMDVFGMGGPAIIPRQEPQKTGGFGCG